MKKILSVITVMVLIFAMMCIGTAEEEVCLRLEGGSGNVGDLVTVTATAENAPECKGFTMFLAYDSQVLEPVSAQEEVRGDFTVLDLSYEYSGKPVVRLEVGSMSRLFSGNTRLATFQFRIKTETAGNFGTLLTTVGNTTFSRLNQSADGRWMVDPVDQGCRVYVGGDEAVSTAHAVEVMRHLIGKTLSAERAEALDWDGNGALDIADAVLLLRELN